VRLAVVGAGVLGSALARRAALDGHDVTLVEAAAPGHGRAASGDVTRIIRCAHGDDAWHTRSARRAWALWHEIDPALVEPCGVAWLARRDDGFEAASERTLRALGIPCERLEAGRVAAGPFAWALWEPEAGVLRAARATAVLAEQAVAAGARLVRGEAAPEGDALRVGGRVLEADAVAWACGAWLPGLFPGLLDVRVTQQDVFYYDADVALPAWCDYDGAAYGTGSVDGCGLKVCPDETGPPLDVRAAAPPSDPHARARAERLLAERFPPLAGTPLRRVHTCQYELTADTRAVLARHPEHPSVWLLGGTSGHGFKHAPAWAETLLRWIAGAEPPEAAFGLGDRGAGPSLRTAGTVNVAEAPL
jgi:sarcosine oxidase